MQTPKEYAIELVDKYIVISMQFCAVQCAKLAVNRIIEAIPMYTGDLNPTWKFYTEVLTELNKM